METSQSKPKDLTSNKSISIGTDRQLYIQCQQRGDGQKFFMISKFTWPVHKSRHLPGILVPQDAYKFVATMDEVIRQLPMEDSGKKKRGQRPVLTSQKVYCEDGQNHAFNLSVVWHPKPKDGEWVVYIRNVYVHRFVSEEKELHFPLWAFPWLRQQMAKILSEHDGSERIEEMPTMPEWANQDAPNMVQEKMKEDKDDDAWNCYFCAVANTEKKGSKCWWHTTTSSMDWPIADHSNSGMGNASK